MMVALPTTSYGQGVAVTPIQMLQAYNTIANDGIAVDPVLVLDDIDAAARRVIEPATASQMMTMLREVVENVDGTGRRAAVAGFDVVGKTGTAGNRAARTVSGTNARTSDGGTTRRLAHRVER